MVVVEECGGFFVSGDSADYVDVCASEECGIVGDGEGFEFFVGEVFFYGVVDDVAGGFDFADGGSSAGGFSV